MSPWPPEAGRTPSRSVRVALALSLALALGPGSATAQQKLYRWVGPDGQVHYTDNPPPAEAARVETRRLGDAPGTASLPFELQRLVKAFPVILFTADCGEPCQQAQGLLQRRGIPHTVRNAREEAVQGELRRLTGRQEVEVPLLTVGRQVLRGWEPGQWSQALDEAGYPRSSRLPPNMPAGRAAGGAAAAPPSAGNAPAEPEPRAPARSRP